MTSQQSLE